MRRSIHGEVRGSEQVGLREAARLILEGKRLAFALKIVGSGEEFPRLHRESAEPAMWDKALLSRLPV